MAFQPESLRPALLWRHFNSVCGIPHCSGNEKALGDFVLAAAKARGCAARRDAAGNVLVEVPASKGREKSPVVVLQGHLDMVCEKNSGTKHDFERDPIRPVVDGEWVRADGTTLGADNGMGVAAALAVMEDDSLTHGPLELLFTVDEETGLNGANGLQPGFLKGRFLLNLDSEEEGVFFIGCAGGADSDITLPLKRDPAASGDPLRVTLSGLRGGHSGIDIHTGRGNAVQLLSRLLFGLETPFSLVHLEGGNKHNAIPREAFAHVLARDAGRLKRELQAGLDAIRFEYKTVEKDAALSVEPAGDHGRPAMDGPSANAFLSLLMAIPHGVLAMSQEIPDLVETSNNLAIVRCAEGEAKIHTSTRSSIGSALAAARAKIEAVARLAGAGIRHLDGYPGWAPNLQSPLLDVMKKVHRDRTGRDPEIKAVHAGLECGIIGEKYPGMDMISFGPDLRNPHSPDEKVSIPTVERFYGLLAATLKTLAG
jgi:dipeptidase D